MVIALKYHDQTNIILSNTFFYMSKLNKKSYQMLRDYDTLTYKNVSIEH